jgi:hypothetical protein
MVLAPLTGVLAAVVRVSFMFRGRRDAAPSRHHSYLVLGAEPTGPALLVGTRAQRQQRTDHQRQPQPQRLPETPPGAAVLATDPGLEMPTHCQSGPRFEVLYQVKCYTPRPC